MVGLTRAERLIQQDILNDEEWLDLDDLALLERVRTTGYIEPVYGFAEIAGGPYRWNDVFVPEGDWPDAEQRSRNADRTNSAFLTDELIAARRQQREDRAALIKRQEAEARKRRHRKLVAQHRSMMKRLAAEQQAEQEAMKQLQQAEQEAMKRRAVQQEALQGAARQWQEEYKPTLNGNGRLTLHEIEQLRVEIMQATEAWVWKTSP
jgi:hypothetical protein